ncbi:hypothetical protein GCM10027089_35680 [Nocardia thraciensis]
MKTTGDSSAVSTSPFRSEGRTRRNASTQHCRTADRRGAGGAPGRASTSIAILYSLPVRRVPSSHQT